MQHSFSSDRLCTKLFTKIGPKTLYLLDSLIISTLLRSKIREISWFVDYYFVFIFLSNGTWCVCQKSPNLTIFQQKSSNLAISWGTDKYLHKVKNRQTWRYSYDNRQTWRFFRNETTLYVINRQTWRNSYMGTCIFMGQNSLNLTIFVETKFNNT